MSHDTSSEVYISGKTRLLKLILIYKHAGILLTSIYYPVGLATPTLIGTWSMNIINIWILLQPLTLYWLYEVRRMWNWKQAVCLLPPGFPFICLLRVFTSSWGRYPSYMHTPFLWTCVASDIPPPWPAWVKPPGWKFPFVPEHPIPPGSQGYAWE